MELQSLTVGTHRRRIGYQDR